MTDAPTDDVAARTLPAVEWPTLALVLGIHAGWLLLTWFHAALAWWIFLPLAAVLSAWWGSAQHEILHGHPTRRPGLNTALAMPPYWLWLPYERYRQTHLVHHDDRHLTDPLDDPESRYWTAEGWAALGPLGRRLVEWQGTLAGRLAIGPVWTIGDFLLGEWRAIRGGDRALAAIWARHAALTAIVLAWLVGVCAMPFWLYLADFVQGGLALTLMRSFAEHRAAAEIAQRTAIVENSRVFGPLFLFNNLHAAHHRWPDLPWYRLPAAYRRDRAALIAENGGLVYDGYADLFRRFLFRAHDRAVHPLGRAP